ncbi:hypothetical protein BFW01_g5994 [Lasiodiplodia theobromae]|nr:hypothetical protein BFW01_g5994 [Lasiodiplodia theobromae]
MQLTFSSPAEYPSEKSGTRKFNNDLRSWYTRTCDGVDTAAETDRLVKLMEEDKKFFLLARLIVTELRWTSDDPTPPNPNLNEFLDRVKHLQPQTSTSTRVLGLPRLDRAMAIHRTGELLERLRKIEPMTSEDLAATEEYREALKKYSGFTKEVEDIFNRAYAADTFQGPLPHPKLAQVDQDLEHKRNNLESSASGQQNNHGVVESMDKAQKPISPPEAVSG